MLKKILKLFMTLSVMTSILCANSLSFQEAWDLLLKNSEKLKAKNEDVNMALFEQNIAKDLYLPNISIFSSYTHLSKEMSIDFKDNNLELDKTALHTIISGIAKGTANATYMGAIKKGLSPANAQNLAKQEAQNISNSFLKLSNDFKNSSLKLSNQNLTQTSIKSVWGIFTGGKRRGAKQIAKARSKEAKEYLNLAKQGEFEDLSQVYFGVLLAKEIAKTKHEVAKALKKHLNNSQLLFKHGQVAKIEVLSAKARYDKALVDANTADKNAQIAKLALKTILYLDDDFNVTSKLFTNNNLPNLNFFMQKTLSSYPALKILDHKQQQADGLIKVKKADYYPQIFLFGDYTLYKDDSLLYKNKPTWKVGLGVNYDIFSSKGRKAKLDIAYSKKLKASLIHSDSKRKLSLLVQKTYKLAILSLQEYEGLKSSVELGIENIKLRKKLFSQGMGTSLDVIDAELFLQGVKIQRLLASYKYVLSLSKLLALSSDMESFFSYQKDNN